MAASHSHQLVSVRAFRAHDRYVRSYCVITQLIARAPKRERFI
jgi:hypothetical protein